MTKRVLNYDPLSGMTTTFEYHAATDTTILHREQDISTILDTNKALQNEDEHTKRGIKSGFWHYAQIPNIIAEKWMNEHGVNIFNKDHQKKVFKLLNQPEYRYLKTTTKMHWG